MRHPRLFFLAPLATLAVALVALPAPAQPTPPPPKHDVFEATVTRVGPAPGFLCGDAAALQVLDVTVTRATAGRFHRGDHPALSVLACFGGPLLRLVPGARAPVYELDPAQVRPGTRIAFDVTENAEGWIETTEMRVLP
jgi:hypothetical protein